MNITETKSTQRTFESGAYSVTVTENGTDTKVTVKVRQIRNNPRLSSQLGTQSDYEFVFLVFDSFGEFLEFTSVIKAASP